MSYITVYRNWLPYACAEDKRGFISNRFSDNHSGVDSVNNRPNNSVCAVINGTVLRVYASETYGNTVEYGAGNVRFALYHLANIFVTEGQTVQAGKTILGIEGNSGSLANGKHLHVSMWLNGVLIDPEPYLSNQDRLDEIRGDTMKFQVGDLVYADGKLAVSAYSTVGNVTRGDLLRIEKIYNGTNFPYALAVNGVIVGFARENEIRTGSANPVEQENERLKVALAEAEAKLEAIRKVVEV